MKKNFPFSRGNKIIVVKALADIKLSACYCDNRFIDFATKNAYHQNV